MDKLIIASAQQQMRLFDSVDSYRKELNRFLYMARAKGAQLIVFPALSGVMATSHRVEGFRVGLLKQADGGKRSPGSFWRRARGTLAGGAAALLSASFRQAFVGLLKASPDALAEDYEAVFAELARVYSMTIVAGSAYLPGPLGAIRHRALVFGPTGDILGRHDKLALSLEDEGLATAGDAWHVVSTPVGRLGILIGEEALYPEAGRVLAYQGADLLVALAAAGDPALAAYIRHGALAQAQENRIFALTSFLVGKNYLAADEGSGATFVGKSGIYAPLELTPHYTGVLVEMGATEAEGLVTAQLDRALLQKYWESGVEPVRKRMPVALFASYLPTLYSSRHTLADAWENAALPPVAAPTSSALPAAAPASALDEAPPMDAQAEPVLLPAPDEAAALPPSSVASSETADR